MATKMTREEALKKVRQMSLPKETMEILEALAPELAESEDERIRKELKEAFEAYDIESTWNGIPIRSIFAWLEKQKEQNLIMAKSPQLKEQKPLPPFDEMSPEDKMDHPLYLEGFDMGREVQKVFDEQKPAEWSEEDEKDMAHIIRILDDCYVYGTHDLSKTDHENLVNKLKSLRPSWKPSEEQPDVDIREEIKKLEFMGSNDARDIEAVAKHFYELGLKSK